MYLQYSRYLRRNIALVAIYILLTIAVVGLFLLLCISNSRTDLPFMVRPRLDTPANALTVHRPSDDAGNDALNLFTSTNLVDPTERKSLAGTGIEINTEPEQQHIYIDDVSTTSLKPQRSQVTDRPINVNAERDSSGGQGSGALVGPVFNINEFDDENDEDDEAVTSGSGNSRATTYDLETKDFIKRISIKLSQLSKVNPKKEGQRFFKLGMNNLINRERIPIPDHRDRAVTAERRTSPKIAFNPHRKFEINSDSLSTPRGFVKPAVTNASAFSMLERQLLPSDNQIRTRRIISNEKKSDERSRQLLLCFEMGNSSGRELCRMLFKETES